MEKSEGNSMVKYQVQMADTCCNLPPPSNEINSDTRVLLKNEIRSVVAPLDSLERGASRKIERVFDILLASLLLIPALLILFPVYLLYFLTERTNGPFLFRAARLGYLKQSFNMLKVRTMVNNAEKRIGGTWHKHDRSLELWYGRFLRNTKIDELPQLFNILKGDMAFVGPRPVRPADYDNLYSAIKNSELRFQVHPGLTGYSQYYTPGSTPRKIRVHIDNYFVRKNKNPYRKLLFVLRTAIRFTTKIGHETLLHFSELFQRVRHGKIVQCRRRYPRTKLRSDCLVFTSPDSENSIEGRIIDANTHTLKFEVPANQFFAGGESIVLSLPHSVKKRNRHRYHAIKIEATIESKCNNNGHNGSNSFLASYCTCKNTDAYWMEKYILKNTFAG